MLSHDNEDPELNLKYNFLIFKILYRLYNQKIISIKNKPDHEKNLQFKNSNSFNYVLFMQQFL